MTYREDLFFFKTSKLWDKIFLLFAVLVDSQHFSHQCYGFPLINECNILSNENRDDTGCKLPGRQAHRMCSECNDIIAYIQVSDEYMMTSNGHLLVA